MERKKTIIISAGVLMVLISIGIISHIVLLDSDEEQTREELLDSGEETTVVVFYGEDCEECKNMIEFVEEQTSEKNNIGVKTIEVQNNEENRELYNESIRGVGHTGVPAVQISDQTYFGFSDEIKDKIQQKTNKCSTESCGVPNIFTRE